MPTSPSSSIDSPPPFATSLKSARPPPASLPPLAPLRWRLPVLLFTATVASIFFTGAFELGPRSWRSGLEYAVPLLAILLTHEFGHFVFARIHRVNASLPMFIPLPLLSPFGTMGAVIIMRDRIRSRNALLDIGAAGPLAGMIVAMPVLFFGLAHSQLEPFQEHGIMEGQCLLYLLLKRAALGPIPEGWDVQLSPMAFAGWVGLFVTMLNLLPVGQLDGGHIAHALFGRKQELYSRIVRTLLPLVALFNFRTYLWPLIRVGEWDRATKSATSFALWLLWFVVLTLMRRLGEDEHPPTDPGELSPARRVIAVASLVLFVLIFMPTPWRQY
jgi:membrane-associated protease RseP (regulator of RpoE activity)